MNKLKLSIALTLLFISLGWMANQLSSTPIDYLSVLKLESAEATPAIVEPQFQRTQHEDQSSICKNARTSEHYVGVNVSREEVWINAQKYWSGHNHEIAVALTIPEGQRDLNCIGDETPEYYGKPTADGRHWGESVGLYQYRTIIEAKGSGTCDDIDWQLGNIERQTQCAYSKWDARDSFQPWAAYTSGRYLKYLGK